MKTPILLVVGTLISMTVASFAVDQDVAGLVSEAQRAYIQGNRAEAQEKFELVRRLEPGNRVAVSYLRRIMAEKAAEDKVKGPPNVTKAMLEKLILDKVQFKDAGIAEALEFLRQKGNAAAGGKMAVNFVKQFTGDAAKVQVTLSLEQVPFTEVLRYIGELANVEFVYERFAIVVRNKSAAPTGPAPAAKADTISIRGLEN